MCYYVSVCRLVVFFFKQKTAYEMRISDWSSDVCSSDLGAAAQEIRILHQWAEGDARDRTARIFAQEAETRSHGLKFRVYPNSSLDIKPRDQLDALQSEIGRASCRERGCQYV